MGHTHARWSELSTSRKVGTVVVGLAQVTLTAVAYRDLARRPAEEVNGPKVAWGLAILVNWVGPITYLAKGRRTT
ncbi:PLDc N-terminal domain-containing protein [Cellulomonas hominis]|uniref:Cardiolipin synthase N-terminal domain-containing protein n=1 Tax=Cellulomonas hominis TaxID=156981 RepID=A0A511FE68_9CELL|nr:PLDc N-terminal domain-containing protein [Cellulomonas hominis]MBB5475360.1 hypothetical protein [Cellulomonas hominis]MBU5423185.1 PLDc N-terminal domain-containing protein [Cellulomonas hominis]NKY08343.1 PLDc_N domain-containing protein [Cellulomonas hominis]NKY10094.1 PLDc_N domain-containing protein [Cellulomonas hominis]GEL46118.1 hypothetical protein CHO01_12340 [Cellulomonas hominis]